MDLINVAKTLMYIKPGLEMPKNTEWQKQISTKRARRVLITAVISSGANCQEIK